VGDSLSSEVIPRAQTLWGELRDDLRHDGRRDRRRLQRTWLGGSPISYVLPTIRTFTVGPGVSPGPPAAGCGRVADCHRRFGVAPTPEHVWFKYGTRPPTWCA